MDLRGLQIFMEVAEQNSFTRAGEKFLRYHLDVDSMALHMYEQMKGKG